MPSLLLPVALSASALAAMAGAVAYAAVSDESQWFGPALVAPPYPQQLALTFDDGPNPAVTPALLDLLASHGVRATFFLIGRHALREPALTRRIASEGHSIGNHTMDHPWLPRHGNAFIRRQMRDGSRALADTLGQSVTLFRAPHGARRPAVFRAAQELGLTVVQWNSIVGDWKPIDAQEIFRRLQRDRLRHQQQGRGTCAVLHDGGQHTLTAERTPTLDAIRLLLESAPATTRFVTPTNDPAAPWL